MNATYENFIGVYTDVFVPGFCAHVVQEFDRLAENGAGATRVQSENALKHVKSDLQLEAVLNPMHGFNGARTTEVFFQGLQNCYEDYLQQFSTLRDDRVTTRNIKLQRTDPGGGYHIWHAEQAGGAHASRVLVYLLYLNTLPEESAGETEFLYQQKRIKPVENTLVIWPAAFTHTHRGNTVFGTTSKYVATGWFCFD